MAVTQTVYVQNKRLRATIAEVNAGVEVLPALAGYKYRMIDCQFIAVGGAAAAHTTIDITGTQSTAVKLAAFAVAQTAQNTVLRPGITGCAVLADGASFVACDAGAAVNLSKTGSAITTATHVDIEFTYALEAA
jgi:hypothetical protein